MRHRDSECSLRSEDSRAHHHDDCTTLHNSRHLHTILESEIYRSTRYQFECSLIFVDLDHFKNVNDTHGHLAGSKLLSEMGQVIKDNLRVIDFAFRYGGDEFVILLPQTSSEGTLVVAKRLLRLIQTPCLSSREGLNLSLTASLGVATFPDDAKTKAEADPQGGRACTWRRILLATPPLPAAANQGIVA